MENVLIENAYNKDQHLKDDCNLWDQKEDGDLFQTSVYTSCQNCRVVEEYTVEAEDF